MGAMSRTPSTMLPLGTCAPDFALPDTAGRTVRRSDLAGQPLLVAFICNHCPFVLHLRAGLVDLAGRLAARGLATVAINSNDFIAYPADAPEHMAAEAQAAGFTFPYLLDASQEVAIGFQAACTPDFFLFDAGHRLAYRGQFDDSRPHNGLPVSGADLQRAAEAILAGAAPPSAQRPSLGCNIKWRAGGAPPWAAGAAKLP